MQRTEPGGERKLRVGIACNIRQKTKPGGRRKTLPDEEAEFDEPETVEAIRQALLNSGYDPFVLEASADFQEKVRAQKPDIVFNIAEGISGRDREAQIPAILSYMGIPYTGSDTSALAVSLDKHLTKEIAASCGVLTPASFVVKAGSNIRAGKIHFPVIVKPNAEGSSKGIGDHSVARNMEELKKKIAEDMSSYREDLLVEEYVDGREFTVGLLGNGKNTKVFPPMEIIFRKKKNDRKHPWNIYSFGVKQNYREYIDYQCPADIPSGISKRMMQDAKKIYDAMGCLDFARMDFRLSADNRVCFIEANPLPGLAPGYSDYPMLAEFNGISYGSLVPEILSAALKRYQMKADGKKRSGKPASGKISGMDPEWGDWKWQYRNRIRTVGELSEIIPLMEKEKRDISGCLEKFRMAITPYYASLIRPDDPHDPIRMQAVPSEEEMTVTPGEMADPLNEEAQSPAPNIVKRYPDRVLFLVTRCCAMYCRHCTRRRLVGEEDHAIGKREIDAAISYIAGEREIRDVLISGGDPLTLSDEKLEYILSGLRKIPHVEIIRIGTRVPCTMPQRITPELVGMLKKYQPLWINTHFNHPRELTADAVKACGRIVDAGIPLGNQSVLLKGVNDDARIMKKLLLGLVKARIRPYYLYQCDMSEGLEHFRTDVRTGIDIIRKLTGSISGFAVPKFVIDAPGGGGKVPVNPDYIVSLDDHKVVMKNYLGKTYEYPNRNTEKKRREKK